MCLFTISPDEVRWGCLSYTAYANPDNKVKMIPHIMTYFVTVNFRKEVLGSIIRLLLDLFPVKAQSSYLNLTPLLR